MKMTGFISKKRNIDIILCLEALIVFALSVLAVHDTNTSAGAGYSLFIRTGALSREGWNVIVDLALVILMIVLLIVPSLVLKSGLGSSALFFLAVSAFSFYARPDRLIAPFTGGTILSLYDKRNAFVTWFPTWIICAGILMLVFFSRKKEEYGTVLVCAALSAASVLLGFITPAFEGFLFAAGYFIAMPFLRLPPTGEKDDAPVIYGLVPGTVLFLCGAWKLIFVLSTYHM
ncbi:MAG: hypothetical protein IKI46_06700 [Lachnospiraceae bacterium]|nr:hypothetical protein [Lachnospiraceae bacterium]